MPNATSRVTCVSIFPDYILSRILAGVSVFLPLDFVLAIPPALEPSTLIPRAENTFGRSAYSSGVCVHENAHLLGGYFCCGSESAR